MTTVQTEILAQLAEIQRTLGMVAGATEALKEEVKTQGVESSAYRQTISSGLQNALMRVATLEKDLAEVKDTIDKTLRPLATGAVNVRQRIIGFLAAWSLFAAGIGALVWFFSTGLGQLIDLMGKFRGMP
jgi:hypothetical protein